MENSSLETMVRAWQAATPQQQTAALYTLIGTSSDKCIEEHSIIRWKELAKKLQVSKPTIYSSIRNAGISPVVLPGRVRSIGIRSTDLCKIIGGNDDAS